MGEQLSIFAEWKTNRITHTGNYGIGLIKD